MKYMKIPVAVLLLCMLVLSGCATKGSTQTQPETQPADWESVLEYAEYLEMTKQEQDDFYNSFEDPSAFFAWFDAVKAIYDAQREENQYDGGSVDIGSMSGD